MLFLHVWLMSRFSVVFLDFASVHARLRKRMELKPERWLAQRQGQSVILNSWKSLGWTNWSILQSLAHPHPRVIKVVCFIRGLQDSRTRFNLHFAYSQKNIYLGKLITVLFFHQKSKHLFFLFFNIYLKRFEAIPRSQNDLTSQQYLRTCLQL